MSTHLINVEGQHYVGDMERLTASFVCYPFSFVVFLFSCLFKAYYM